MTTNFRRETAHLIAEKAVTALLDQGLTLPAEVTGAHDRLQAHLDRGAPVIPDADQLAAAYVQGATDKQIDAMALAATTGSIRSVSYSEATKRLGVQVLRTLTSNGDDLTTQLAALAAPRIAKLEEAAALSTLDVAALLRGGDTKGADVAAHVSFVAGELAHLYSLRKSVTHGADYGAEYGFADCGTWRDPRIVRQAEANGVMRPSTELLDRYLTGIRLGAGLWFPTPGEAEQVAREIADEEQERERKAQADNRRRGFVAFAG